MSDFAPLLEQYGPRVEALVAALATGSKNDFLRELDSIVHLRERDLFTELRKLTGDLQGALERFRLDSRLIDMAEKEVPDARQRLDHVLKLTDEAAHTTLDLVERSGPLAERTSAHAGELLDLWKTFRARQISVADFASMVIRMDLFLEVARTDTDQIRRNLAEVLMAQGYQDLTGQIIRGVMKLVLELETALVELVRLSSTSRPEEARQRASDSYEGSRGHGPAVPGVNNGVVVSGQVDVDALLSGLGM